VGNVGGSLSNGRWRVDLPAVRSTGPRPSGSASEQLEPLLPARHLAADKNHFSTPVSLTVDCSSVPQDQLKNYVIFWFDRLRTPGPRRGSSVDLTAQDRERAARSLLDVPVGPSGGKAGW